MGAVIVGITYLICVCIREVLEPRLMGSGAQVSSVAMLIAVYAGVLYYGIGGVLWDRHIADSGRNCTGDIS